METTTVITWAICGAISGLIGALSLKKRSASVILIGMLSAIAAGMLGFVLLTSESFQFAGNSMACVGAAGVVIMVLAVQRTLAE